MSQVFLYTIALILCILFFHQAVLFVYLSCKWRVAASNVTVVIWQQPLMNCSICSCVCERKFGNHLEHLSHPREAQCQVYLQEICYHLCCLRSLWGHCWTVLGLHHLSLSKVLLYIVQQIANVYPDFPVDFSLNILKSIDCSIITLVHHRFLNLNQSSHIAVHSN